MKDTTITHNRYHIGDNLIFLHLLRAIAKANPTRRFRHYLNGEISSQCAKVVADLPNIELFVFDWDTWKHDERHSIDTWKNAEDQWVRSAHRWDWVQHTLEHHEWTARRMGFESPFRTATDLLFDYPALGPAVTDRPKRWAYDFFVCNSEPNSGQFGPMRQHGTGYLDRLIGRLGDKYPVLSTVETTGAICTRAYGHDVSAIGRVSVSCKHHIMIATGPMWSTLNTHNHHLWTPDRKRIVLLDNGESLTGIPHVQQCATVEEVFEILKQEGLL